VVWLGSPPGAAGVWTRACCRARSQNLWGMGLGAAAVCAHCRGSGLVRPGGCGGGRKMCRWLGSSCAPGYFHSAAAAAAAAARALRPGASAPAGVPSRPLLPGLGAGGAHAQGVLFAVQRKTLEQPESAFIHAGNDGWAQHASQRLPFSDFIVLLAEWCAGFVRHSAEPPHELSHSGRTGCTRLEPPSTHTRVCRSSQV
jgi:hypothetical protein